MTDKATKILTPSFVTRQEQRIVGITRRISPATLSLIPQLWKDAINELGNAMQGIPNYGACFDFDRGSFTYLAGIADDGRFDTERLDHLILPASNYAVFNHEDHISRLNETWRLILEEWLPDADVVATREPEFELYTPDFDPATPGGVSIWIPVVPKG